MKITESQLKTVIKESILEMLGEKANSGERQTPHVVRTLPNNYSVVCIRCRNGKFKMNIMDTNGQLLSKYWFDAVGKNWENGFGKNGTYTCIKVKLGYKWLYLTDKGELVNIPRMPSAKPLEGPETEDWWLGGDSDPIFENRLREIVKSTLMEAIEEKAKSKAQQRFMGMVHAVQKGELDSDEVGSSVAKAAKTMKKKDVKDFAETKHKGLPNHVDESKLVNLIRESIKNILKERESLNFPAYAEKYYKENGKKLPDDVLNAGNKKWSDRFHDNKPDGKYRYIPLRKKNNE